MPRTRTRLRDPRHNLDVTADEADRFWAEQMDRAQKMRHIGPRRAHRVIEWMKVTPGWSVEDYDEYFADLHRCGKPPTLVCQVGNEAAGRA